MKAEMKKAVFRIVADKFRKTVSSNGLNEEERQQFLSTLNSFLVKQIQTTVNEITKNYPNELHEDIVTELQDALEVEKETKEAALHEEEIARLERQAKEYELIRDFDRAEKYLKKLILREKDNVERWNNLSRFLLKRGHIDRSLEAMRKALDLNSEDEK